MQQARASGRNEINSAVNVEFDDVDSLDEAISRYTVIVAEPIARRSYVVDDLFLETWYKFRVSETLSQRTPYRCPECTPAAVTDPPADMLPLNPNEILIHTAGGEVTIDGVSITETVADLPAFMTSQRYLLFLNYDASRKLGGIPIGPRGAYMVIGSDTLSPVHVDAEGIPVDTFIAEGLRTQYNNRLSLLRSALNPPPPPPGCDPMEEQACYSRGGTWNPGCYCTEACQQWPWLECRL